MCRFDEIEAILDEIEESLCEALKRLESSNPKTVNMLHGMLTLLFYAALKYKECCSVAGRAPALPASRVAAMFRTVKKLMADEWIVKHYSSSVGGVGGAVWNPARFCKHAKDDIEVHIYIDNGNIQSVSF